MSRYRNVFRIEDKNIVAQVVNLRQPEIQFGFKNECFIPMSGASFYGILRRWNVNAVMLTSSDPIYVHFVTEWLNSHEYYCISWNEYMEFLRLLGGSAEVSNWQREGF